MRPTSFHHQVELSMSTPPIDRTISDKKNQEKEVKSQFNHTKYKFQFPQLLHPNTYPLYQNFQTQFELQYIQTSHEEQYNPNSQQPIKKPTQVPLHFTSNLSLIKPKSSLFTCSQILPTEKPKPKEPIKKTLIFKVTTPFWTHYHSPETAFLTNETRNKEGDKEELQFSAPEHRSKQEEEKWE